MVGAGPGDPDLLTVKALRLIEQAQVILYDRTVSPEILALSDPTAVLIFMGSAAEAASRAQSLELMRLHARAGHRVVRLCGGDPWLFGPGPDEAAFLQANGVEVEVVPGVSCSLGAPELAGIPYAAGTNASFAVLSAEAREEEWIRAADFPELVVWAGGRPAGWIARRLLAAGRRPGDAVAVLPAVCTGEDRCRIHTLAELAGEEADSEGLAVCVIGDSVIRKLALAPAPGVALA
jgi:siroheme synthase